jgi:cysteine desulfurase
MAPWIEGSFGNPSGLHGVARRARNAVEESRERVAAVFGARPGDVVFTGGGTEAANLAVAGPALAGGRRRGVVVTAVEHEAVLATAHHLGRLGCPVTVVPVDRRGVVDPERVADAVGAETALVSVMAANNETGVVQPVAAIAAVLAATGVVLHSDAVQAAVSRACGLDDLGADLVTVSAHKLGGPQGVGVLAGRPGIALEPVVHGAGQELGRRSGTPNVAGIVGTAAAIEAAAADRKRLAEDAAAERDRFEAQLKSLLPDVVFTAPGADRLAQHSHLRFPGVDAETLLIRLDAAGVAASAGSACHSGAMTISHVLGAMGMTPDTARQCVRFTFGWDTPPGTGTVAGALVAAAVRALR